MKISRNTPCPCGSGKKYKHCCYSKAQPYNGTTQKEPWTERVTHFTVDRDTLTDEEFAAIMEQMHLERNTRPLKEFLGLSASQMSDLLNQPLESLKFVTFNEQWLPKHPVALELFISLAEAIGEEGIKATNRGNIPVKICMEVLANTPRLRFLKPIRIRSETKFKELYSVRTMGETAGLIERSESRFILTERGHELMQPDRKAELFHTMFKTYATRYNWGFPDNFPEADLIQTGWLFSLYCLTLFGSELRHNRFYSEKFFEAFPMALNEFHAGGEFTGEQQFQNCYNLRFFLRFANFWGIIHLHMREHPYSKWPIYEIKAPDINNLIQFHI